MREFIEVAIVKDKNKKTGHVLVRSDDPRGKWLLANNTQFDNLVKANRVSLYKYDKTKKKSVLCVGSDEVAYAKSMGTCADLFKDYDKLIGAYRQSTIDQVKGGKIMVSLHTVSEVQIIGTVVDIKVFGNTDAIRGEYERLSRLVQNTIYKNFLTYCENNVTIGLPIHDILEDSVFPRNTNKYVFDDLNIHRLLRLIESEDFTLNQYPIDISSCKSIINHYK